MNIEIHPYDPHWPELFQQTAKPIREVMGEIALRIDHIGSTAVRGAAAKPIIDIQISVRSFEPFNGIKAHMEALDYRWQSDNSDLSKRYFRENPGTPRTHIHIRRLGSWSEQFALLFRDYLRCHPEDVQEYVGLKTRLAQQFRKDRVGYSDAKAPFIWQVMVRADAWCKLSGWQPGQTDM